MVRTIFCRVCCSHTCFMSKKRYSSHQKISECSKLKLNLAWSHLHVPAKVFFLLLLNWTRCWSQTTYSASFMCFQNTLQFQLFARFIYSETLPRRHLTKSNKDVLWRLVNYFWNKSVSVLKAYLSTCKHIAPTGKIFICRRVMSVKGLKTTHFIVSVLQNIGLFSHVLLTIVNKALTWI